MRAALPYHYHRPLCTHLGRLVRPAYTSLPRYSPSSHACTSGPGPPQALSAKPPWFPVTCTLRAA
ncbi:hypothetical protein OH77DRAFT_1119103 [Trametes cingulata]|nr:hypothetical protein OH77DRAFT_1119103 [Trametes cingulata]